MANKEKKESRIKSILKFEISFGTTSLVQRASFAKNMAVMLKSGLTINQALSISAEQSKGRFHRILSKMLTSVESGNSLADAMSDYPRVFSGLFVNIVKAGELSGRLDDNLESIASQLEKDKALQTKIKGAMMYPTVILIATFILGLAMAFLVLPKITPLLRALNVELPFTTRALIWFADLVANNGFILFIGSIAMIAGISYVLRQKFSHPVTHWLILRLPIVKNISRNSNLARFCRTLGTLLQSGLNIDDAINISKETVTNYYFISALSEISKQVGQGVQISTALLRFENIFPVLVTRMVAVGEKSGKIEELLFYLADFYDMEVDESTKNLSTAIEPILLLVIGVMVAGLALAIITPIYQVTGSISEGAR